MPPPIDVEKCEGLTAQSSSRLGNTPPVKLWGSCISCRCKKIGRGGSVRGWLAKKCTNVCRFSNMLLPCSLNCALSHSHVHGKNRHLTSSQRKKSFSARSEVAASDSVICILSTSPSAPSATRERLLGTAAFPSSYAARLVSHCE